MFSQVSVCSTPGGGGRWATPKVYHLLPSPWNQVTTPPPWDQVTTPPYLPGTLRRRAVHILLECILVSQASAHRRCIWGGGGCIRGVASKWDASKWGASKGWHPGWIPPSPDRWSSSGRLHPTSSKCLHKILVIEDINRFKLELKMRH